MQGTPADDYQQIDAHGAKNCLFTTDLTRKGLRPFVSVSATRFPADLALLWWSLNKFGLRDSCATASCCPSSKACPYCRRLGAQGPGITTPPIHATPAYSAPPIRICLLKSVPAMPPREKNRRVIILATARSSKPGCARKECVSLPIPAPALVAKAKRGVPRGVCIRGSIAGRSQGCGLVLC
jgi:hypothetical protein